MAVTIIAVTRDPGHRILHAFYVCVLFIFGALFIYQIASDKRQMSALTIQIEQRNMLSNQAVSLQGALPNNGTEAYQGIVLSIFGFLEKWRHDTPIVLEAAKSIVDRSITVMQGHTQDGRDQQQQCMVDAQTMVTLLKGIAAQ
jgi:hypothetical protein